MANESNALIGILGGTFDPIHLGHCELAVAAKQQLRCEQLLLMPCYQPVHRDKPMASPAQRLAMVSAACRTYPELQVCELEMQAESARYTIDTVQDLRQLYPERSIVFILGMDAFQQFNLWRNWQSVTEYVHLAVIKRPGYQVQFNKTLQAFVTEKKTDEVCQLHSDQQGHILFLDILGLNVSATELRQRCSLGRDISQSVPEQALKIIIEQQLYQIPR